MLNRLSLNSLRKVYYFLINSNPDVNFYCMCMKNRKKEVLNRCLADSATYVSTDYKAIRAGERKGCVPLYYRAPHALLQYAEQPELSKEFARVYHTLCSLHLFNGERCYSFAYEHSFLCLAPALAGFIQHVSEKVKPGQQVVFLCDEYSLAFQLYQSCFGDQGRAFRTTDVYKEEILIVDPVPGQTVLAEHMKELEVQQPALRYETVTMSGYLGVPEEETRAFAQILRANLPAQSWDVDDEAAYTFETIINPETLREIRHAVSDFIELFSQYQEDHNPDFKIKAKDAASLLIYAKAVTKELADGGWVK